MVKERRLSITRDVSKKLAKYYVNKYLTVPNSVTPIRKTSKEMERIRRFFS